MNAAETLNAVNQASGHAASSGLTFFDWCILIALGSAGIWGAIRGFTSSVLNFASTVAALAATLFLHAPLAKLVRPAVSSEGRAELLAFIGGFIFFLILFKLTAYFAGQAMRKSPFGLLDRSLGALFGLFATSLGVFFLYFALTYFLPEKMLPDSVRYARFRPLVAYGATWMAKTAPGILHKFRQNEDEVSILEHMRNTTPGKEDIRAVNARASGGYGAGMRTALDKAIENMAAGGGDENAAAPPPQAGETSEPPVPETPQAAAEDRIGRFLEQLDNPEKQKAKKTSRN